MSAAPNPPDLSRLRIAETERAPPSTVARARFWPVAAAAAAAAVLGFFGRGLVDKPPAPAPRAEVAPNPAPAQAPAPAGAVLAGGRVESRERRELAFAQAGVVAAVHVERGQRVKAGDILVELDDRIERADVDEKRAALAAADARLRQLSDGARPEELEQAERDLDAALAVAKDAADKAAQAGALFAHGGVSRADVQGAQHAADAAQARAKSAQARVDLLTRGARRTAVAEAQAEVARARAALAAAEARLAADRLIAPIDGTVVEVRVRPGEVTGAQAQVPPALVLTDPRRLVVKVDVPEAKAVRLRRGDPAVTTVEALSAAPFPGRVADVGVEADRQKGTLEVTVDFDDSSLNEASFAAVRPRMAARVEITPTQE